MNAVLRVYAQPSNNDKQHIMDPAGFANIQVTTSIRHSREAGGGMITIAVTIKDTHYHTLST